ncbi:hypothetical protein [Methylotenera sp. N17]|uniref:hypothetical protein n=1 Tax=Methylotenera sp. N17 TaxID=1502761 RepID=UPI0006483FB9|nr:hypothetical protein [Methylotenera sp. N17]
MDNAIRIGSHLSDQLYANMVKTIRNKMRKYRYETVLELLLQYLNSPVLPEGNVEQLQKLPWVTEKLMLWLLADNPILYQHKKLANEKDIEELIRYAWNSADDLYVKNLHSNSIKLFVRAAILPQIPYQTGLDTYAFLLQVFLLSKIDANSKLRRYLDESAGMSIYQYFQLGVLCYTHTVTEKPWFNAHYIQSLKHIFSAEDLITFFESISFDRAALNRLYQEREIKFDEWFQPVILYKTPCIRHEGAIVSFGRPTLRRYFENLIGDWLEDENGECLSQYNNVIAGYVEFALSRSDAACLDEAKIRALTNTTKQVCDFLVEEDGCYLLIEVKNKSLTQKIPASLRSSPIVARLKATVIKAREQLDATRDECQKLLRFKGKVCYRLIVTKSDLWLGDISSIIQDYDDQYPIWLLSLSDLDQLVELVISKVTTFNDFFNHLHVSNSNPQTSVFTVSMLLDKAPYKSSKLPAHLQNEADKLFELIKSKIQS